MDSSSFNPQSGNYIAANGRVYNMVELLGGGTPINDQVFDINQYAPKCGLVLGRDGRVYDLTELLRNAAAKPVAAAVEEASENTVQAAERKRAKLLRASDRAMALDRLELPPAPDGATFKAWEPFLAALAGVATGEIAMYRKALRDLPQHPDWPNLQPGEWPQPPVGVETE